MKMTSLIALALVTGVLLAAPRPAQACPFCTEVATEVLDGDATDDAGTPADPLREARAINQSIYLMLSMPYLLLGVFGTLVYRGYRRVQREAEQRVANVER